MNPIKRASLKPYSYSYLKYISFEAQGAYRKALRNLDGDCLPLPSIGNRKSSDLATGTLSHAMCKILLSGNERRRRSTNAVHFRCCL